MVSASATECGPPLKATVPASARSPISAISWAMRPLVSAAKGSCGPSRRHARAGAKSTTEGSSTGGLVSGRMTSLGDAARRSYAARARLAMLDARLADEAAHVDEARRADVAGAVDDAGPAGTDARVTAAPTRR